MRSKAPLILIAMATLFLVACAPTVQRGASFPELRSGTLSNGLSYHILPAQGSGRIFLMLGVRAGSLQEGVNQKGFAHLIEHMAFRGSPTFPRKQLDDFLENLGGGFGPEDNAFTYPDATIYHFAIPSENPLDLVSGLRILSDWAHGLQFDDAQLEIEKKIIREERRMHNSSTEKSNRRLLTYLTAGTDLQDLDPIGRIEDVSQASPQSLLYFYRDFYRPDLLTIVIAGDIDPDNAEGVLQSLFFLPSKPLAGPKVKLPTLNAYPEAQFQVWTDPDLIVEKTGFYAVVPQDLTTYRDRVKNQIRTRLLREIVTHRLNNRPENSALIQPEAKIQMPTMSGLGFFGFETSFQAQDAVAAWTELNTVRQRLLEGVTFNELNKAKNHIKSELYAALRASRNYSDFNRCEQTLRWSLWGESPAGLDTESELRLLQDENETTLTEWLRLTFAPNRLRSFASLRQPPQTVEELGIRASLKEPPTAKQEPRPLPYSNRPLFHGEVSSGQFDLQTGAYVFSLPLGRRIVYISQPGSESLRITAISNRGWETLPYRPGLTYASSWSFFQNLSWVGTSQRTLESELLENRLQFDVSLDQKSSSLTVQGPQRERIRLTNLMTNLLRKGELKETVFETNKKLLLSQWHNLTNTVPNSLDLITCSLLFPQDPWLQFGTAQEIQALRVGDLNQIYHQTLRTSPVDFIVSGDLTLKELRTLAEDALADLAIPMDSFKSVNPKPIAEKTQPGPLPTKKTYSLQMSHDDQGYYSRTYYGPATLTDSRLQAELAAMARYLELRLTEKIRTDRGDAYNIYVRGFTSPLGGDHYELTTELSCDPQKLSQINTIMDEEIQNLLTSKINTAAWEKVQKTLSRSNIEDLFSSLEGRIHEWLILGNDPTWAYDAFSIIQELSAHDLHLAAQARLNNDRSLTVRIVPKSSQ